MQRITRRAFLATGAVQCGFCIPGQLIAARAMLSGNPHPTRADVEEGLAGNLCRCAGYEQIIEAVLAAAEDGERRVPEPRAHDPHRASDPAATPDARVAPQ